MVLAVYNSAGLTANNGVPATESKKFVVPYLEVGRQRNDIVKYGVSRLAYSFGDYFCIRRKVLSSIGSI